MSYRSLCNWNVANKMKVRRDEAIYITSSFARPLSTVWTGVVSERHMQNQCQPQWHWHHDVHGFQCKIKKKKVQLHQPASHIGLGRLASSTNRSNSCLAEWMCPQKSTVLDLLSENTQMCHLCPTQCHSMVRKSTTASNREQWSLLVPLVITQHGLGRQWTC